MVNRVISSFQSLRASSLVAAFVLNLRLSIFFFFACTTCILLLVHYLLILIATFLCFLFSCCCCVFCFYFLVGALFCCFHGVRVVFLTSEWPFPVLFCPLFITIIILYSFLSFVSWSSATAAIFGNKSLVWFLLISQRKTHQIVCIATWTGVLRDEECFLFFFFFFFFNILLSFLMILYLISMFALVLQFCSTFNLSPCFYFCYCSFFFHAYF